MRAPEESESLAPVLRALAERGHEPVSVAPMAGDVSRRRYLRLEDGTGRSLVLAVYPEDMRDSCRRYLGTGRLLAGCDVRVPRVLDSDCDAGWVLLEDLGERTLYEHRTRPWSGLAAYFEDAVACIGRIAGLPADAVAALNPPLDRELLGRELAQTRELFLDPLGLEGEGALRAAFRDGLEEVCRRLAHERPVPCHRDFGARNLMPLEVEGRLRVGVLDHQDLRLGPPGYDLASLLNDSLFPPPEAEERLLVLAGQDDRTAYHRAAAQRTLKAIGSYASFARRGSGRHLGLIPTTLRATLAHLGALPETTEVTPLLEELWAPALAGMGLDRLRGSRSATLNEQPCASEPLGPAPEESNP